MCVVCMCVHRDIITQNEAKYAPIKLSCFPPSSLSKRSVAHTQPVTWPQLGVISP